MMQRKFPVSVTHGVVCERKDGSQVSFENARKFTIDIQMPNILRSPIVIVRKTVKLDFCLVFPQLT